MLPPNFKTWLTAVIIAILALLVLVTVSIFPLSEFITGRAFKPVEYADGPPLGEEMGETTDEIVKSSPSASGAPKDPPPPVREVSNSFTATQNIFFEVFGRWPTRTESAYWDSRRSDKPTDPAIRGAMQYYLARHPENKEGNKAVSPSEIDTLFFSVWGRNPTSSERQYWTSRIADKPFKVDLVGAMQFHQAQGYQH